MNIINFSLFNSLLKYFNNIIITHNIKPDSPLLNLVFTTENKLIECFFISHYLYIIYHFRHL